MTDHSKFFQFIISKEQSHTTLELISKNDHVYLHRMLCTLGLVKSSVNSDTVQFVQETRDQIIQHLFLRPDLCFVCQNNIKQILFFLLKKLASVQLLGIFFFSDKHYFKNFSMHLGTDQRQQTTEQETIIQFFTIQKALQMT